MTNLKEYVIDLMQKTLKRFDQNGKRYILDNPWTVQILDYLLQYYRYVGDTLKTAAESRIIALKEEETRDRETILEDFNKSKLRYSDFQSLKEQINIFQIWLLFKFMINLSVLTLFCCFVLFTLLEYEWG